MGHVICHPDGRGGNDRCGNLIQGIERLPHYLGRSSHSWDATPVVRFCATYRNRSPTLSRGGPRNSKVLHLSLPKTKSARIGGAARPELAARLCLRTARSASCGPRPSQETRGFASHCSTLHISPECAEGARR